MRARVKYGFRRLGGLRPIPLKLEAGASPPVVPAPARRTTLHTMGASSKLVAAGVVTVGVAAGAGWYLNRRLAARVQQLAAPTAHPPTLFATSAPEEHQQRREANKDDFDGSACIVAGETAQSCSAARISVRPYKPELSSVSSQAGSLLQNLPSRNPLTFANLSRLEAPTRLRMKRTKPRRPAAIYLATHDRTQPPSDHRVSRTVHADAFLSLRELLSSLPLRAIFFLTPFGQVLAEASAWCKTCARCIHFLNDTLTMIPIPNYPRRGAGWLYFGDLVLVDFFLLA